MQIALHPVAVPDKPVLDNLMQLYLHDFSEISGADADDRGRFDYPQLDLYWTEAGRHPFAIRADGHPAGFALVNRFSPLQDPFEGHAVAEFFVMRKYRRRGVGRAAAMLLFDHFPGHWEVATAASNIPAQAFWRSTIDTYTSGRYQELWLQDDRWHGPIHQFVAPPGAAAQILL